MSEAVDTRVVEAKFDSAQFEKGVDRTVKKLDELKKSLDLEESGKSIAQLASKTQEATEKASGALEKLENRITTFTGMLKNKLLSGIADEVVGAVFKMKNAFEGLVKTLSTGQIASGMQRYTDIMGSVRTLVFSGVKQETAYSTIERLGMYADQTSYSLDQLVSTMSKFKTAGASLDTAERMVIGLSNAAASMGVNAQEASRAYLNLQQAYSKGAMLQNDWISFESLPMVGEKFNQAILDAAVHIGTLKKEANGTYSTINKIDKQVKTSGADAKGITAENLGTKLSSRWFNKAVMQEVFGSTYYFNLTDTEEESASEMASGIKKFEKGMKSVTRDVEKEQESLNAALEKKEITKDQYAEQLSQLATEDVYSQFSDDFKKNAPDPKQMQSELQKSINDYMKENKLDKIDYDTLYTKQLETYLDTIEQKMLDEKTKELDEALKNEEITLEEYNKQLEEFKKNNNLTRFGWEAYRAGQEARSLNDVLNTLKDTISRGWATSFELIFGKLDEAAKFFTWLTESNLANAIYSIGTFRNNVLEAWAGNENEGGRKDLLDALEKLDEILGRLLGKFHIFTADEEDSELAAYNLGARLSEATRNFKDFVFELDQWLNDERVQRFHDFVEAIGNVLKTVFQFAGLAASTALRAFVAFSPVLEALTDNITKIINKVNEALANEGYGAIKDGIDNVFIAIEPLVKEDGPLVRFINFLGEIASFFAEMAAGTFVSNVQFFSDTLGFLIELFGGTSAQKKNYLAQQIQEVNNALQDEGLDKETRSGYEKKLKELLALQEQVEKLDKQLEDGTITPEQYKEAIDKLNIGGGVLDGIKNSIMELGNTCKEAIQFVADFFHNLYEDILVLLGIHEVQEGEEGGLFSNLKKYLDSSEFVASVKQWIKDIPKNLKKFWATIDEWLFGKKVKVKDIGADGKTSFVTVRLKSGVSKMLDDLFKTIKEFITVDVPKKAKEIWNSIIEAIFGKSTQSTTAPNTQVRGSDDMVKSGFQTWFEKAVQKVKDWIADIPEHIKELWNTIIDFIFYRDPEPDEVNPETNEAYGPTDRVKNGFRLWLEQLPEKVWNWITNDFPNFVKDVWNKVVDLIVGPKVPEELVGTFNEENGTIWTADDRVKTGFWKFLERIPNKVKDWYNASGGWKNVLKETWNNLMDFVVGPKVPDELIGTFNEEEGTIWTADDRVKTGFWKFLEHVHSKVSGWIQEAPTAITEIWDTVLGALFGNNLNQDDQNKYKFDQAVYDQLMSDDPSGYGAHQYKEWCEQHANPILDAVTDFVNILGIDIGKIIAGLPASIVEGWNFSLGLANSFFENLTGFFKNKNAQRELVNEAGESVSNALDATAESVAGSIEGSSEEAGPLLTAIITFGQNVGKMVKTTIPELLTEAWDYVSSDGIKGIEFAVRSIFGLKEGWWKELDKDAEAFGKKVAGKIQELPDKIRAAVGSFKELLNFDPRMDEARKQITKAFTDKNGNIIDQQGLDRALAYAEQQIKNSPHKNGLWEAVKEVFGATGSAMKDLAPDILDGLNSALDWLGKGIGKVTEAFNYKAENGGTIEEAVANTMEGDSESTTGLISAIKRIGTTIYDLITNIIPEFVKSAINVLSQRIPELLGEIGNIFGGGDTQDAVKEAAEEVQETVQYVTASFGFGPGVVGAETFPIDDQTVSDSEKAKKNSSTVIGNVIDIISSFTNISFSDNTGKLIALLGSIALIVWGLKSTIDNLIVTDDVYLAFKWSAINTAIKAIVGLIGYMILMASTGSTDQLKAVDDVFDKVDHFLSRLVELFTVIKAMKWITDITSAAEVGPFKKLGVGLSAIFGLSFGADVISTGLKTVADDLTLIFQDAEIGFGDLFNAIDQLAQIEDKIEAAKLAMGHVHELFVELYSIFTITDEDFEKSNLPDESEGTSFMSGFARIMQMFTQFNGAVSLFKQAIVTKSDENATDVTTSMQRIVGMKDDMKAFAEFANSKDFEDFKAALMSIGGAMQLYSMASVEDFNVPLETWRIENAVGLLEQIFGNEQLKDLIEKVNKENIGDTKDIVSNAESITIFAGALVSIARACSEITDETGGNINKLIETMKEIKPAEGDEITSISLQFGELGNALSSFAANTLGLTDTNMDIVERALKAILQIAIDLKGIPSDTLLAQVFTGDKTLEGFAKGISAIGDKLKDFFGSIQNLNSSGVSVDYNRNNLELALMAVDSLSHDAMKLGEIKYVQDYLKDAESWFTAVLGDLSGFGTSLMKFLDEINSFKTTDNKAINFGFVYQALEALGKLVDVVNSSTVRDTTIVKDKVQKIGEALFGEGIEGSNGIMGYMNQFFAKVIDIAQRDGKQFDLPLIVDVMTAYSTMIEQVVKLINDAISGVKGNLIGVNVGDENPLGDLMKAFTLLFESFNDDFDTFDKFLKNVQTLNLSDINKAEVLFTALNSLASALYTFSHTNSKTGEVEVFNGLSNLNEFNWEMFKGIRDRIFSVFENETDFHNVGLVAGQNLDAGLAQGIGAGTAIEAARALCNAISGTFTVSWQMNSPSKLFEEFGGYLDAGLANGIEDGSSDAIDSAATLANNVIGMFRNVWGVHSPSEVAKILAMYFDQGLNDGLLKYGALPVGAAEDTADTILDVMNRALENNDTPDDVKSYAQMIIDELTDFDESDIDKGYWKFLTNIERYQRMVDKETEKINEAESNDPKKKRIGGLFGDMTVEEAEDLIEQGKENAKEANETVANLLGYLWQPKDPTKPGLLEGFLGDVFGAGLTSNVELTEEDQETVKNAIKLLKGEVNEVASEAVKEEAGNNIFTSMSIWDLMMFRTRKSLEYDENSGFAKAGKFAMAFADRISKIKQNLIPNLSGVVDDEGIWNTIIHMYTDKSGEMQKLTSALLSDMTQIGDKYPELSGVAAALGEVFKQLDKSGGGWDVLGQVLDAAAKEFTDNDAIQYVNKIFGQLRSAAEGKEGSELGYSITDVLLSSVNEFLTGKFGDSPVVNAVTTYANSIPEQIKEAIASGKQGAELVEYLLGLVRNGAEDYLSDESPLAAMVVEKISELIGLSKDEDLTIEPKVKPVLEMSDDFKSGMDTINSFLGGFFNPAAWFGGENPTLNTNTSLDLASQIPQPKVIDYSSDITTIKNNMSYLQSTMAGFNRSLSSMRFVIKGSELAYTIGPDINEYLGYEDMTRGSRYDVVPQYQT